MAILVKDSKGRSPYWICCYTASDGRRLKKSTKQTDRTKATEICLALERAEGMAARGTLTETRARELIGEVLERTTGEILPFYTAEAWLRDWLRGKQISKSENTHIKYSQVIESFLTQLGGRAKLNIAAISTKDIVTFRDDQIATGKSPNTVRFMVKQLRIPFNAARRQGLITHNPAEAVELPSPPKLKDDRELARDAFTPDQIEAMINAAVVQEHGRAVFEAGRDWRGAILFAYFTGARLQDVANIQWSAIDLPAKAITYRAKKTGRLVAIPIHPKLEEYLLGLRAPHIEKEFVFPKLAQRNTGGRSGLSMSFSRIMARAGVRGDVISAAKGKGRTVRALTFHSLRHSFNSAMANAGIAQEIRMKLTGHTSADMNKVYTHHELEPLRGAINVIPAIELQSSMS
jgi:integrase